MIFGLDQLTSPVHAPHMYLVVNALLLAFSIASPVDRVPLYKSFSKISGVFSRFSDKIDRIVESDFEGAEQLHSNALDKYEGSL